MLWKGLHPERSDLRNEHQMLELNINKEPECLLVPGETGLYLKKANVNCCKMFSSCIVWLNREILDESREDEEEYTFSFWDFFFLQITKFL